VEQLFLEVQTLLQRSLEGNVDGFFTEAVDQMRILRYFLAQFDGFLQKLVHGEDFADEPHFFRFLRWYLTACSTQTVLSVGLRTQINLIPVRTISIALDLPTILGRRWVPPAPGMVPIKISGWPNLAVSPA
jgi:hypothetical protein